LLANLPGFYMRWSPDGRSIRFTVEDDDNGQIAIWEVGTDGRHLHQLTFNWPGVPMEGFGEWTADGRYYVFVSKRNGISNLWAIEERSDWMHRPRHDPVQLTAGPMDYYRPLPSSDGTRLFAIATRHAGQLLRYDMVRKKFAPFMGGASADQVSFTRDGQWVAYVSYPEETLWRARADGSEALQLTLPPLRVADLRWSPDGKSIAFSAQQPGERMKVELISRDGGNSTPLLEEPGRQFAPTWSVDGNFLAYTRCSQTEPGADCALYRFELAAKIAHKIPGSDGLFAGVLAPDGRHLAAVEATTWRVFLVDLQSGQRTQLTRSHLRADCPIWSHDSQYVYFNQLMSAESAIFRVRVSDAREEKVTDVRFLTAVGFLPWSGLAPDGSLLLLRDLAQTDVYALSLARP
jgi:Tol biopolymer transport system component